MFSHTVRLVITATLLVTAWALSGCQRSGPPLDQKVQASTSRSFQQWRGRDLEHLTPDQAKAFDEAVQELKLRAMLEGSSGNEAIDAAAREKMNGKTVREVIQLGYGAKLARLEKQRTDIDTFLSQNAQLTTRSGDNDSAAYLARRRDQQTAQKQALERQITDVRDQLKALGIEATALPAPPTAESVPATSSAAPGPAQSSATTTADTPPVPAPSSATDTPDTPPVPISK